VEDSEALERSLLESYALLTRKGPQQELEAALDRTADLFITLEGTLSIGSRAAYGELAGQLRNIITGVEERNRIREDAFGLFAARTLTFLASELGVPGPSRS